MNKKLIAAAVSAAVAPVAAHGEASFYGRVGNAIEVNDVAADGDSTTDLNTFGSRLGFKYDGDIGNGMTAHGRIEFSLTTDKEGQRIFDRADSSSNGTAGTEDIRIGTAGVSGPFGRIDVGNQWSAYFNTFGTLISPTYTMGYYIYSSVGAGPFRGSNTIKYSNDFGPVHAELDIRLNDREDGSANAEKIRGDGIGLGLSWAVSDNFTLAVAYDSEERDGDDSNRPAIALTTNNTEDDGVLATRAVTDDDYGHDEERVGISARINFGGGYWLSAGWQSFELDNTEDIPVTGEVNADDDDGTTAAVAVDTTVEVNDDIDTWFVYGGGKLGEKTSWLLGYSEADDGIRDIDIEVEDGAVSEFAVVETDNSESFVWGVYHSLGGGVIIYYEGGNVDGENNGWDGDRHVFGMQVSF